MTYNMGEKSGPDVFSDFTFCQSPRSRENLNQSDAIVIGVQECSNSILKSFIYSDKASWIFKLKHFFKENFDLLALEDLNALNMVVFIRKDLTKKSFFVDSGSIYFGFYGLSPHKAVQFVSFSVNRIRVLVCNLHLPCDRKNFQERQRCIQIIYEKIL